MSFSTNEDPVFFDLMRFNIHIHNIMQEWLREKVVYFCYVLNENLNFQIHTKAIFLNPAMK